MHPRTYTPGNALLFIRDESVPVRMDRPLVLFCFVNANAQPV